MVWLKYIFIGLLLIIFVTRKITKSIFKIVLGLQDRLYLVNIDAKIAWGHVKDYIKMIWIILQADETEDLVLVGECSIFRFYFKNL